MNAGVPSKAALPGAAPDPAAGAATMVGVVREVGMEPRTDPAAAPTYYVKLLTDTGAEVRLAGHGLEAAAEAGMLAEGRRVALRAEAPGADGAPAWTVTAAPGKGADALRSVIDQVMSGRTAPTPTAPATPAAAAAPGASEAPARASGLLDGAAAMAGGAAALAGGVLAAAGRALAPEAQTPQQQAGAAAQVVAGSGLPAVLPRLSEYRLSQVEKAANTFAREQEAFWQSSPQLTQLRGQIQGAAQTQAIPVQDVVQQMKPGGALAPLGEQFAAAVAEAPGSGQYKKAMDKALDSYTRQYGRAQEEILNPDLNDNPHYDGLKERLRGTHENMEQAAAGLPGFTNSQGRQEPSHFEKLQGAVGQIMERIREVTQEFMSMLRGRQGGEPGGGAAPPAP